MGGAARGTSRAHFIGGIFWLESIIDARLMIVFISKANRCVKVSWACALPHVINSGSIHTKYFIVIAICLL
jgi:hypothetical protein